MKILITGGNGYIARNLTRLLSEKNHVVLNPGRIELDVTNLPKLKEYVSHHKPDAIIHTAIKGGHRTRTDTIEDFVANMIMFENIISVMKDRKVIVYGSGAEYDRRGNINEVFEMDVFNAWPIDFYGLSKNLITRRIIDHNPRIHILRIFGCFNHDEDDNRFIKSSILNIKRGLPIEIHQDKLMDFIYMDDLCNVTEHFLLNNVPAWNVNVVYPEKMLLSEIAKYINDKAGMIDPEIHFRQFGIGLSYSGNGERLSNLNIPLIGLEEGINRTLKVLL